MDKILFLTHRLPYPPNKGDKVRSYHLLKHLAARHKVFLGTFIDDPHDATYVDRVEQYCAEVCVVRLEPRAAQLRSLSGFVRGEALTLPYYRDRTLRTWVRSTIAEQRIDTAVVFSSSMAQYVSGIPDLRVLIDFVDADSAKWSDYATARAWPMSWIYRREGKRLLAHERAVAARSVRCFFVTDAEAELFRAQAPECAGRVSTMCNGVDAAYFSPDHVHESPYSGDELPIAFTGAMDYWPNVDAACWFASDVLPRLRARWPGLRFYVVGMRPAPSVQALAGEGVVVTGTVPDVRPYLQHAAVVVTPLRVARGIQNKVLEAMAMSRPVVASRACAGAIEGASAQELVTAADAGEFVDRIDALLREPERAATMGEAARRLVLQRYSWVAHLSRIDPYLHGLRGAQVSPLLKEHALSSIGQP